MLNNVTYVFLTRNQKMMDHVAALAPAQVIKPRSVAGVHPARQPVAPARQPDEPALQPAAPARPPSALALHLCPASVVRASGARRSPSGERHSAETSSTD